MANERFTIQIEVEGPAETVARLRHSLPEFIQGQGIETVTGTKTVASWMIESRAELSKEPPLRGEWGPGIAGQKASRHLP